MANPSDLKQSQPNAQPPSFVGALRCVFPTAISPDMTEFPLNLAAGLRMVFADVACAPIPQD